MLEVGLFANNWSLSPLQLEKECLDDPLVGHCGGERLLRIDYHGPCADEGDIPPITSTAASGLSPRYPSTVLLTGVLLGDSGR